MENTEKDKAPNPDDNLTDLLDSCLDDFNKPIPKTVPPTAKPKNSNFGAAKDSSGAQKSEDSAAWSEEFKEVMENFITNESDLDEMKKLMDSLSQEGPAIDDENFAQSFSETIRELTQQAQNIPETSPEDLANLLGTLGMGDGNQPDLDNMPDIMPLMQNVMQKLMSKELLYPSIKEIVEKYPSWLSDNKSSLETKDYQNYSQQLELMKKICEEFEKESDESDAAKKEQFEKVLQFMQKIQTYGNPPKELVANVGPGIPLDEQGNFSIPGMQQQCVIM